MRTLLPLILLLSPVLGLGACADDVRVRSIELTDGFDLERAAIVGSTGDRFGRGTGRIWAVVQVDGKPESRIALEWRLIDAEEGELKVTRGEFAVRPGGRVVASLAAEGELPAAPYRVVVLHDGREVASRSFVVE